MKIVAWLGSWRFLLSRRWVLFFLTIVLVGAATWWLGEWQFGRLDDRKERNQIIRANETQDPAPVDDVLAADEPVAAEDEWRVITATGVYDTADTVVIRYRTDDRGLPGVDAVVPLVTEDGTALLVDRGWFGTDDPRISPTEIPAPPTGEVTITGWVRADGTGDSTRVDDNSARAISSVQIGDALDRTVYGGFIDLRSEDPEPAEPLEAAELPDLGNGPHFFYGLQWWFFGVLAAGGFAYLAWDERRHGRRGERRPQRRGGPFSRAPRDDVPPGLRAQQEARAQSARVIPPSTGSATPDRNDAAGESRNAATRPNSSGRP
ncbi:SURF1 family protein [Nocardioides sp. YIM 152588]|uniref:SURF1 family cytochrome oxidase biogenesis protein n=1 Tax=Nocardioides sp. YIM 152588 TaxID=3158259 RepID=UPI0032E4CB8C